jgi:hypothetical protein
MLRRYTNLFSDHSTFPRPRCYKSEEKAFAFPCKKPHISPASYHSRTQTRGRSNTASLATFRLFSHHTFLLFLVNTFSEHCLFGSTSCLRAWSADYWKENKLDARSGLFTQFSPSRNFVEGGFWAASHSRGACQSLEVIALPASSRITKFTSFCQTRFHITSSLQRANLTCHAVGS